MNPRDTWKGVAIVLPFLLFMSIFAGVGYLAYKAEQDFKEECVAIPGGRWFYDKDSDLECYVNGIEIAEHGETSPRRAR